MNQILIAEDNPRIGTFLETGLQAHGFTTTIVTTGREALQMVLGGSFDLLLLDLELPDKDGLNVLFELRGQGETIPIIILTARDGAENTVAGLDGGADDYITKPFRFEELLARIRICLQNHSTIQNAPETILKVGEIVLNLSTHEVWIRERLVKLSPREFLLLEILLRHPMQIMTRDRLLDLIWTDNFDSETNVVNTYIGHLRRKLGKNRIETVRGIGYRLRT
jgi:DNA-binding response OmpR family regulator